MFSSRSRNTSPASFLTSRALLRRSNRILVPARAHHLKAIKNL
jgi:hypothetical protein